MKNITLSADADLIDKARERAAAEHTTLNAQFRIWLENYVQRDQKSERTMETIRELQASIFTSGRTFSREEMNER
ncbi:MAG: hypothetical protein OXE41_08390 [Gammaproteobacteria bacterium]|nr:hypothetical protein [Gammaproteobacteria bacterium]MCY4219983.1 hypothetical protein [Gammaproteobacteria bacterium]MCY4275393.1 hypothetical protein [Gammaproteobacteria bacterium]